MVASLGNLYGSLEKLHDVTRSEIPFLLPETSSLDSPPENYYRCLSRSNTDCWTYVAEDPSAICPSCGNSMNHKFTLVESPAAELDGKGGFVQGVVTYMVMDCLEVKPMSTISSITLLSDFYVKKIGYLEERVVSLGVDEINPCHTLLLRYGIKLPRASLHFKKVLTDVFFGEKK
ncbi:hypothetical protein ACJRO7_003051 [Eucalyptus globulus]|uniref:Uncharacterized protein n=1 Tax=Eucalyptus globulus TaxID=34317 RepID=A0ABD3IUR2_EUCGL